MDHPHVITKISDNGYTIRSRNKRNLQSKLAFLLVVILCIASLVARPTLLASSEEYEKRMSASKSRGRKVAIPSLLSYSPDDYNTCDPTTSATIKYTDEKQDAWDVWLDERNFPRNRTFYAQFWNYSTHSIEVPNKRPDDPPTSLELLQDIIHANETQFEYFANDETKDWELDCFRPRLDMTQKLVDCDIPLAYPILNVGFPKDGSSTLFKFFQCTFKGTPMIATHDQFGRCNRKALEKGQPPLSGCPYHRNKQALMQMDQNYAPCAFPQISMLDEIHQEHPNATFVLNFRPIHHWMSSAAKWKHMTARWRQKGCIKNLPGFVKLKERPKSDERRKLELQRWWCSHISHIRAFVKQYPSHKLIELDLYDDEHSADTLATLFDSKKSCWGQTNVNKKNVKVPEAD